MIPCVGAVIFDPEGRLCLVRRANEPSKGTWAFPGGRVEPDETSEEAIIREVMEETGWRIAVTRQLGVFRRFTYMPEYDRWAEKVCTIRNRKGGEVVEIPIPCTN